MFKKRSTKDLVHPQGTAGDILPEEGAAPKQKGKKPPRDPLGRKLSLKEIVKSRVFLGSLCIAAALLLAFVATPLIQLRIAQTVSVVVLKEELPAGTQLTSELLTTREMGALNLPADAVTSIESVVGGFLRVAGAGGDILTGYRVAPEPPTDDPALAHIPEGKMAMSATLADLAQSLSGKLRAGDVIRLYATLKESAGNAPEGYTAIAVPELQYVEVLAVTNSSARDVGPQYEAVGQEASDSERQIATVTLAVNAEQAKALAGLEQRAALHAALVVRGGSQSRQDALDAQEAYFAQAEKEAAVPAPEPTGEPQPSAAPTTGGEGVAGDTP